jgi:hypothetical protein
LRGKRLARISRIISAQVNRLAQFGECVIQRFAALILQQCDASPALAFERVGSRSKCGRPGVDRGRRPARGAGARRRSRPLRDRASASLTNPTIEVASMGPNDRALRPRDRDLIDQRGGVQIPSWGGVNRRRQGVQRSLLAPFDAGRIASGPVRRGLWTKIFRWVTGPQCLKAPLDRKPPQQT